MSDEESKESKELTFRDRCAIAILQALFERGFGNEFVKTFGDEDSQVKQLHEETLERTIRASYKIADMMRRARLSSFK